MLIRYFCNMTMQKVMWDTCIVLLNNLRVFTGNLIENGYVSEHGAGILSLSHTHIKGWQYHSDVDFMVAKISKFGQEYKNRLWV